MKRKRIGFNSFLCILSFVLIFSSIPFYRTNEVQAQDQVENGGISESDKNVISGESTLNNSDTSKLTEIPDLRNANSKVFLDENGSYIAEVYLEPIHYEENNQWIEIDNTLISSEDNQSFENTDNQFEVEFPKKPFQNDETKLFTYQTKGHAVQIDLKTDGTTVSSNDVLKEVLPKVNNNQIVLEEPIEDISFEYVVDGSKVKENIILHSYQGKNSFQFTLNVKDLEAKKQTDGSIHFFDKKGEFVFLIERPYMYDSNTEDGPEGVISQNVTQEIEKTESGYLLTITADEAFLKDPKRVYPVTIDPWIDVNQAEDTFVASSTTSNFHNTDYLSVGYDTNLGKTRSLLKFNLPLIPNGEVTDAQLQLEQISNSAATQVNVHQITAPFTTSTVTWTNQPTYKLEETGKNQNSLKGEAKFTVTNSIKEWYESPSTNYGFLLKFPDSLEGSSLRKTYYSTESVSGAESLSKKPKLTITFKPLGQLGLTDYWTYTPDNFQGEGTAVVNVINGNLVYYISLLNLSGKTDAFNLALTYNSLSSYNSHYGFSWMFNAHESLFLNSDHSIIEYKAEGGARYLFTKQEDGTYRSPEGGEGFELTKTSNGFKLKDVNETIRYFDYFGRNYEIIDENGNQILYTFENATSSRIIEITERTGSSEIGRSISLTYKNDYLESITDFKGYITFLNYETVNNRNVLSAITYAKGSETKKTIKFSYDPITVRLNAVTDGNGNVGKIEYDPATQRVQKLIDPRSDEIFSSLEYGTDYTIYTNSIGSKTKYSYSSTSTDTINVHEIIENYQSELEATWKYTWDKNRILNTTEPDPETGESQKFTAAKAVYDDNGELKTLDTVGNQSLQLERTGEKNNVSKTTGSSLVENRFTYDLYSNVISTSNNLNLTDYNQYDRYGNIIQSANPTSGNNNRLQNSQFEKVDASA